MMTRGRKTFLGMAGVALTGALLFGALHVAGLSRRLDLLAYDSFFLLRGARRGSERIVFVDIDDDTVRDLGSFPVPRTKYTELIRLLSRPESRALAVGFDIFVVDRTILDPRVDQEIGSAARKHGRVFFPAIFPEPFVAGRARLDAALEARRRLVDDAYFELERDPRFRDRFRADPAGARPELAARLRVDPERIDQLTLKLLDERDVEAAEQRVRNVAEHRLREFLSGRLDAEFGGLSEARLAWMKRHAKAVNSARVLWETFYLPALKKDPEASFLDVCAGRGVKYAQLAVADIDLDRMLRARLAARRGASAEPFGPSVLNCYAGRVPKEYPVLPVLEGARELVSAQPYLTDGDGKVRSFPLVMVQGGRAYPAMGLALALEALGARFEDCRIDGDRFVIPGAGDRAEIRLPVDGLGRVLLDWNGPWMSSFRHVSLSRLLPVESQGEAAEREAERLAASLKGKIVLVGLTASGSHDLNPMSFEDRYPMVGVNAHVADGVLRGSFPRELGNGPVLVLLVLGGLAGALAGGARGRMLSPLVAAAGAGAIFFGSFGAFALAGLFLPPVPVLGAFALAYVAGLFWRYMVTDRESRKVRQAFAYRTSPELVEEMMRNPQVVRLGGKRVEATVFFADLAGFTSVAESVAPEDLIHLLNAYLSEISAAVISAGGYLDKYEGDAVMAIMGAPVERADHAAAGCRAALETQRRLEKLRERLGAEGQPLFRCRVGLASGEVVVGNIGSETRFDYTALGDNVNLASRLEGASKVYGTRILISEKTAELAGEGFVFREEGFVCREVDLLRVAGRREAGRVLELVGRREDVSDSQRAGLDLYARALALYRERKFTEARDLFMEANEKLGGADGPSETFVGRCQRFILRAPPEDWDGVYEMTSK